jgi:hypothetical protein
MIGDIRGKIGMVTAIYIHKQTNKRKEKKRKKELPICIGEFVVRG